MCAGAKDSSPKTAAKAANPRAPVLRDPLALAIFLSIILVGLAADLISKHHAFNSLLSDPSLGDQVRSQQRAYRSCYKREPAAREMLMLLHPQTRSCLGVRFTLSTNPGVAFGLPMPRWAVNAATLVTLALVGLFFATSPPRAWTVHAALAMIMAGALGNLYDRLLSEVALPGMPPIRYEVRDFIDCSQLHYPPVFNVADIWLVVGVALLMLHWFLSSRKDKKQRRAGGAR